MRDAFRGLGPSSVYFSSWPVSPVPENAKTMWYPKANHSRWGCSPAAAAHTRNCHLLGFPSGSVSGGGNEVWGKVNKTGALEISQPRVGLEAVHVNMLLSCSFEGRGKDKPQTLLLENPPSLNIRGKNTTIRPIHMPDQKIMEDGEGGVLALKIYRMSQNLKRMRATRRKF